MPRRANHEGSKAARVKGRDLWRVRVMLDGRTHDCYGRTPKEADAKRKRLVEDHERGLRPLDPRYTVGEWLADWLRLYTPTLAPRTRQSYADTVRLYITPAIGRRPLAKLHQDDIAGMLASLTGKRLDPKTKKPLPMSGTSRRYVYAVLRIALGEAVRQERIHRNVATLVDPPRRSGGRVQPLTAQEADALIVALEGHRHRALIVTALTCGLREGEALGLTWPTVDLAAGTLEVRWQLERTTRLLVEPKRESRRRVDLPPLAVEVLREHRVRQLRERVGKQDWHPADFVFTNPQGQPYSSGIGVRALRTALAGLGLPRQRYHALRHAFATLLLEGGVDLVVVSKLLGHKSITTTSDIYGHLTNDMRRDAAATMDKVLRRAK